MISFNYETEFELPNENEIEKWLSEVIVSES
ncbi:MAG: rRNA maturation factor, partial [Flavobacterium lindanitolerans]